MPRAGLGAGGPSEQSGGAETAAGHVSEGWEGALFEGSGTESSGGDPELPGDALGAEVFFFPALLGGSAEPRAVPLAVRGGCGSVTCGKRSKSNGANLKAAPGAAQTACRRSWEPLQLQPSAVGGARTQRAARAARGADRPSLSKFVRCSRR